MFLRIWRIINDLRNDFTKTDGFTMMVRFRFVRLFRLVSQDMTRMASWFDVLFSFGKAFRATFENVCGDQPGVKVIRVPGRGSKCLRAALRSLQARHRQRRSKWSGRLRKIPGRRSKHRIGIIMAGCSWSCWLEVVLLKVAGFIDEFIHFGWWRMVNFLGSKGEIKP